MIKIVAKNFIQEGKSSDFIALAKRLVEATNKNDEGCLKYELFQEISNPNILTIIEEWQNQETLEKHMVSDHFKEIVPLLNSFAEKQGEINMYRKVE